MQRTLTEAVSEQRNGVMIYVDGALTCESLQNAAGCARPMEGEEDIQIVDWEGGCVAPGSISFVGQLGLVEIEQEPTTNNAEV